jgi:hypothetical protein
VFIGVYSSRQTAEEAVRKLRELSGFRDHPDGFHVESYQLDLDHWTEGFVTD